MSKIKPSGMPKDLAGNIRARERAETVSNLILNEADRISNDVSCPVRQRFFERIAQFAADRAGMVLSLPADGHQMTYEEALKFEASTVPFGIHRGKPVREVGPNYWVAIEESDFQRNLLRYMRSQRFRERQDSDG